MRLTSEQYARRTDVDRVYVSDWPPSLLVQAVQAVRCLGIAVAGEESRARPSA